MKLTLKQPYLQWQAGDVVNLPSGVAKTLIALGKAVATPQTKVVLRSPRNKGAGLTRIN